MTFLSHEYAYNWRVDERDPFSGLQSVNDNGDTASTPQTSNLDKMVVRNIGKDVDVTPGVDTNDNMTKEEDVMPKLADLWTFLAARRKDMGAMFVEERIRKIQELTYKQLEDEALLREVIGLEPYDKLDTAKISRYQALMNELIERKLID